MSSEPGYTPSTQVARTIELLENILNHLSNYDVDRSSRATLATLAITWKDISELALNVLWRHQTNLFPLFRLLPDDLWYIQREHRIDGDRLPADDWEYEEDDEWDPNPEQGNETIHVIKFRRPIADQDTDRFDHYRIKIRRLQPYSPQGYIYILHPSVLQVLHERYAYLLPKLETIELALAHCHAEKATRYIQALLGLTVSKIFIHSDQRLQSHESGTLLLTQIEQHAQNTTNLGWSNLAFERSSLLSLCTKLPGLHTLVFSGTTLSYDDILVLGELPSLEHLEKVALEARHDEREVAASQNLFLQLRSFEGQIHQWSQLEWFLNPNQNNLSKLVVVRDLPFLSHSDPNQDTVSFNKVAERIGAHPHLPQSLTHLTLCDIFLRKEIEGGRERWGAVDLTPLNTLSSLVFLAVCSPCVFFLDNLWLERASESWPKLEVFDVSPPHNLSNVVPTMTLGGLIPLLKNCRGLRSLTFTAIWEPFDLLPIVQEAAHNNNITSLSHSFSSLGPHRSGQAVHLHRCLMALFPSLRTLNNDSPCGEKAVWDEVRRLVNGPSGSRDDVWDTTRLYKALMATQAQLHRRREIN